VDRNVKMASRPEQVRLSMEFEAGAWVPRRPPAKAKKLPPPPQPAMPAPALVAKKGGRPPKVPTSAPEAAPAPLVAPPGARRARSAAQAKGFADGNAKDGILPMAEVSPLGVPPGRSGSSDAKPDPLGGLSGGFLLNGAASAANGMVANGIAAPSVAAAAAQQLHAATNPLANGGAATAAGKEESDDESSDDVDMAGSDMAGADAAAAVSSAAEEEANDGLVRRSGRAAKPRLITVDGLPVLRINNYDLQQGERSVFDQELNRKFLIPSDCPEFFSNPHSKFCAGAAHQHPRLGAGRALGVRPGAQLRVLCYHPLLCQHPRAASNVARPSKL